MADVTLIKPSELTAASAVNTDAALVVDNSGAVLKATPAQVVNAGAPASSEAQALAGTDNTTRMTPLRVRQVLDSAAIPAVVRAQAWAESPSPPDPLIPDSKSSKTWANIAENAADMAAAEAGDAAASAAMAMATSGAGFQTRAAFMSAVSSGYLDGLSDGQVVMADGLSYRKQTGSTAISDINGWVPNGKISPEHYGAVGDGVSDDTAAFRHLEAYNSGSDIDLGGRSYAITSIWVDAVNGARLTRNYLNGRLLVDGRPLVMDLLHGQASARTVAVVPPPRNVGLHRKAEHEYHVWTPLGGRYWLDMEISREDQGLPWNWRGGWVRQVLGMNAQADGGHAYTGDWANNAGTEYNLVTASPTGYIGGRAKQAVKSGEIVTITHDGGGDLFVVFTGRTSGAHVYVTLDGGTDYLVLPDDGAGNRYFDSYTPVDLSNRQIVQIASGVPAGSHEIVLTVANTRNPANTTGYRYIHNALAFLSNDTGPWSPSIDAPRWKSGEEVMNRQVRSHNGQYYYADIPGASFTGSISGTTMTVTAVSDGTIAIGSYVWASNAAAILSNTTIVSQTSGTPGGAGVYEVSDSVTVASSNMTSALPKTTGNTPPSHTTGSASDGSVTWVWRALSGFELPSHRWQASGSQNEYAYWIKPDGATDYEDVGGALHGNEVQASEIWTVGGAPMNLPVGGWATGDFVGLWEVNDAIHSQIGGGSTDVARTTLVRRWLSGGVWDIASHREMMTVGGMIGSDYPSGMCAALHYTTDGYRKGFERFWSSGDGWREFSDYYGQTNPIVGRTKDFLMVMEGPCLQPAGVDGVPSSTPAPFKMRLSVEISPYSVDDYADSRLFAGKAMNTANRIIASGYESYPVKAYFQRSDNNSPVRYEVGDVIEGEARYVFELLPS